MHINGIGLANYIEQIETYEKPEHIKLRKQYAKSNVDLFARLTRPVSKVFSARGGGRYYKLETEEQEREFAMMLTNVEHEYSSKKWVETFWKPRYFDDPMGLIYMEVGDNETYPTYKSIEDIFDYKLSGRRVEWVVFRTKEKDVFRVVDDMFDLTYKVENESVRKVGPTYPNYFGYVPGLVVSDLPKNGFTDLFISPLNDVVELADTYLRDGSIRNIYKFKHGFPKTWKYREVCGDCKSTGMIGGTVCRTCNGTGLKLDSKPSEIMVLDLPTNGEPTIAPDVMGFVSPDIEYLKYSREEQTHLEDLIFETHWGTKRSDSRQNLERETAAGRYMDVQPINDRLSEYADAAEHMEKFIVNNIGFFNYQSAYKGATISYGRRFLVEGPDAIWKKYESARKQGAPFGTLDEHLKEYYETKFQSNALELNKYLKMMRIEPVVHLTVEQAKTVIGGIELARKVYFSEWAATITEPQWLGMKDSDLKESLTRFAEERYEPADDPDYEAKGDDNGGGANNQQRVKKKDKTVVGAGGAAGPDDDEDD